MRFGLLQYPIATDFDQNRKLVFGLLDLLAQKKPDVIVLPEMWLGGPTQRGERAVWIRRTNAALRELLRWSKKHRIGFFLSQIERRGKKYFNTAIFAEKSGQIAGRFRKRHLFSLGGETKIYSAGSRVRTFQTSWGKIACVVCYDIRFPELVRALAIQGAKLLVVCAQWPESRADHWLTLLRARAIENQFFVVGVNRLGRKGKDAFGGHSVVFDPWGRQLVHLSSGRQMGVVDLDLKMVEKIRKNYPFFRERRL